MLVILSAPLLHLTSSVGVNGLEVGQSLVVACSVLIHETLQLVWVPETRNITAVC